MLVEDDFPLCAGGEKAWSDIARVMGILENGRKAGQEIPERRGAFVGTGGSGLIIHKSLLPAMIHVLLTHALVKSPIPPHVSPRPPDVVMQDCLLGNDPICPPKRDGMLVITSRLVMDHIGGMMSTNPLKAKNRDKWRCGWRHPFHGRREVEVVAVD
ncbi:hypothetical protein BDQ17DRAFT_1389556 [Cyathus striatus]|nr:hypothetical protein BDQ17DRAFT_1389556 [Cyathus striatus]